MVPFPLWGANMRSLMTATEWRKVRLALLDEQGMVCVVCGKIETAPSRVYAHEEWEYDETTEPAVARIAGISLVCWHCHACEHWGFTSSMTAQGVLPRAVDDTIAHFCRLNRATKEDFRAHEEEARATWVRRNKRKWRIDYGSFREWTVKTFNRDPLNDCDWPEAAAAEFAGDTYPTMAEIVARRFDPVSAKPTQA